MSLARPAASSDAVSERMRRQANRDTVPELRLRRELHARGLRYYVHRAPLASLRRKADIVFPRYRIAVFVDGCFWHGCPDHGAHEPKVNTEYWTAKIQSNRMRDRDTDRRLREQGWTVLRVWEHEDPSHAADLVEATVAGLRRD